MAEYEQRVPISRPSGATAVGVVQRAVASPGPPSPGCGLDGLRSALNQSPRVVQLAALAASMQAKPRTPGTTRSGASGPMPRQAACVTQRADAIEGEEHQSDHETAQRMGLEGGTFDDDADTVQRVQTPAGPPNRTGLPDNLKAGIEARSGLSTDDVRVHRNSPMPAQLQALAYAQGTDIHLGPGQERHLPHEAWHVVQQKQGRVRPTMQLKDVAVGDGSALEGEAERNSFQTKRTTGRATARGDTPAVTLGSTTSPIQRKLTFAGQDDHIYLPEIYDSIRTAFTENEDIIRQYVQRGAQVENYEGNKSFEALKDTVRGNLVLPLLRLDMSPLDFGDINLKNPQHAIQFFMELNKFVGKAYVDRNKEEEAAAEKKKNRANEWMLDTDSAKEGTQEDGETAIYEVALLGAGAAIAYYLTAHGRDLDASKTVLIGKRQPWSPYAADGRAIGYINHPMHMITPDRTESGIRNEDFEGNDAKLAEQIEDVIGRFIAYDKRVDDKVVGVTQVKRGGRDWYQIKTSSSKVFFAKRVVSGLGIGPHQKPRNEFEPKADSGGQVERHRAQEKLKVMDMDAFHRDLHRSGSWINSFARDHDEVVIGILGPNAGVDAVKSATTRGYTVKWFLSGNDPAIVEGMANRIDRPDLVTLFYRRTAGWTHEDNGKVALTGSELRIPKGERPPQFKNISLEQGPTVTVEVDYVVYAPGPDITTVAAPFSSISLTPFGDSDSKHFDAPTVYNYQRVDIEASEISVDNSIWNHIKKVAADNAEAHVDIGGTFSKLLRQVHEILGMYTFKLPATNETSTKLPPALGLGTKDRSLMIIGGQAHRMRGATLREAPDARRLVSDTLPPTDIIDDQLTPIRSQMEAMGHFMPGYIGTEESNLTTDDQNMIAAQLAGYYANIPPELANWITQTIITERRTGEYRVRPGTEHGGQAFSKRWTDKLDRLQNLFSSANVVALNRQ